MKFLFDQNISHRILKSPDSRYESFTTVKKEGLIDAKQPKEPFFANSPARMITLRIDKNRHK